MLTKAVGPPVCPAYHWDVGHAQWATGDVEGYFEFKVGQNPILNVGQLDRTGITFSQT